MTMVTWDVHKTLSMISDLQNTPCLWDLKCPEYKIKSKKCDAYETLSRQYDVSPMEIEKKVQALKNQFRREHRKVLESVRAGNTISTASKSLWFGYRKLMFLLPQYNNKMLRNAALESYEHEEEMSRLSTCTDVYPSNMTGAFSESSIVPMKDAVFQPPPVKKFRQLLDVAHHLQQDAPERDEFAVYGEHIANKLRSCERSRVEIAIAQNKIDNICFRLTMGDFAEYSYVDCPPLASPTPQDDQECAASVVESDLVEKADFQDTDSPSTSYSSSRNSPS